MRSAGKVYVPPGHKLSCNSRLSPDMYSPHSIDSYIFFKTAGNRWQFTKMVGLAEKMLNVSGEQGTWKMLEQGNTMSTGESVLTVVMRLVVQEGAVAWSRSATGAVTMTTQNLTAFRSYIHRGMYMRHGRSQCSRGPLVVRESTVAWSRSATGVLTMMIGSWQHNDRMR